MTEQSTFRISGIPCVLLSLLLLALPACQKKSTAPPVLPPATVTVSTPLQREVTDWEIFTGRLQSPESAVIQARVSGIVEEAPFREGSMVKKGDVLFVIDSRPFQADLANKNATVAKDQAQLSLAQDQLRRSVDLLKKKVVAQQEYDAVKATSQQAEAQLAADQAAAELARLNLEWTRVAAPIDGRVGRITVTVGNLINGGGLQATELTTVVSMNPLYCYINVPERSFLGYQTAARAAGEKGVREAAIPCAVRLENEKDFTHLGEIDFFDNSIDPRTGTIQVRGVLPNPDRALIPGLSVQMRITAGGAYSTLLVPDVAVVVDQNEHRLLVVNAEGLVEARTVKLGTLFGKLRSIVEGLKPDERVIVSGLQRAVPGSKVEAHEEAIPEDEAPQKQQAGKVPPAPVSVAQETVR